MKSHISKAKLAALAVGLAIVMSSCGIQNQAGDSSGAPAAGKTKNFALEADNVCFEDEAERQAAIANYGDWGSKGPWRNRTDIEVYWDNLAWEYGVIWPGQWAPGWDLMQQAQIGGCTQAFATSSAEASAATPGGNVRSCLPQEYIDAGIAGYTEQINKTYPADWSQEMIDKYKAEMQKGIDALKGTCVSK
jgi:hypothetical protein